MQKHREGSRVKFLITGATGFVGSRLCDVLVASGHQVVALSRHPERAGHIPAVDVFGWNPAEPPPADAFRGVDAVVHLAGESVSGRWTAAKKAEIERSRVLGTKSLVEAIGRLYRRPKVLISASAIGYYGDRADEVLHEASTPGDDFLAGVCRAWEEAAVAVESHGVRCVRLRIGLVLGRHGGALGTLVPLFRSGLGGRLGRGGQWWSWIHIDDVAGMVEFFANRDVAGPINATAPEPVRQREFASALGRAVGRLAIFPAPALALRLVLGEFATELLASRRVVPQAALDAGYTFRYSNLGAALDDLVARY